MLLRSSSTPVLGSLLSSFSESPSNNHYQSEVPKDAPTSIHQKLSCGSKHHPKSLWHSSPSTTSQCSPSGFRRVQSDGNLEELANVSYNVDEFSFSNVSKKFACKRNCFGLEPILSFSSHSLGTCQEDEDSDEEEDEGEVESIEENQIKLHRMHLKEEVTSVYEYDTLRFEGERKMYLALGLGAADISYLDGDGPIGGGNGGNGGGGNYRPVAFDRDGGDSRGGLAMEEHYKRMMEESPNNPLFLRNYAQFLYQTKGDLEGAEEYYCRAILADPEDGEILSQYAKLVWELHRDEDRATSYFERAVQASSHDSHIQAAYAGFLWEIDDQDQDEASEEPHIGQPPFHSRAMASATA